MLTPSFLSVWKNISCLKLSSSKWRERMQVAQENTSQNFTGFRIVSLFLLLCTTKATTCNSCPTLLSLHLQVQDTPFSIFWLPDICPTSNQTKTWTQLAHPLDFRDARLSLSDQQQKSMQVVENIALHLPKPRNGTAKKITQRNSLVFYSIVILHWIGSKT